MNTRTLLIVDDDGALRTQLELDAGSRGYSVVPAGTGADVLRACRTERFELGVVALGQGSNAGLEAVRAIRLHSPDAEIVVLSSASTSLASAIESYEQDVFAVVPRPFDAEQLFATIERAIDHRSVVLANRRLLWEQRLINDIGEELRHLLDPEELIDRVLNRLMAGLGVEFSAARLLNPETGAYDVRIVNASEQLRRVWGTASPLMPRPSDQVLATRAPFRSGDICEDFGGANLLQQTLRSALSVPMFAGDDLIGALSIGSAQTHRFTADDERTLCAIANQVAVGVQSARLHAYIRAGKQQWEAAFDAIGDPIAVFDRDGRLLRGNEALAQCIGRPVTTLRGLSCDAIGLCGSPFPACAVGEARRACVHGEVVLPGERIFSVTTCPVDDPTEGAAIVQIGKDVTREIQSARRLQSMSDELAGANARLLATVERLKTTQAQLLQAEKLSAIGQLVAGVAHELNNPLTSVIGYAQLLQEEVLDATAADPPHLPPTLDHDLRRIAEEAERAAKIVRNLLAFARRQSAARAEQDVADLVTRVLALRAYEFRLNAIELETSFEADLPPVLGDAGQLQQALLNLLLNAEQAMQARPVRSVRVGARFLPDAEAVELYIADTGHGIQEENLRRIFDPFFTTREVGKGTGLGLSICYGIVRDHGGQIAVESRVGQGTTFKLLLPARSKGERCHALVLHRDETERDYVAAALAGWGHKVTVAENLADARAKLDAGGIEVAFLDQSLVNGEPLGPRGAGAAAQQPAIVLMSEMAGSEGVAPPFELAALRAALRGITKECV